MHLTESQINDLVDESLGQEELARALLHVADCAACRGEVEALRIMLHRIAQLPASIAPERDLRHDVWAQADRKTLWSWRYPLAAAAVLLIAISSAITIFVTRAEDNAPVLKTAQQPAQPIDLVSLERQYSTEVEELQNLLRQNRDALAPETVRILEENLRIIDEAIAEARAAIDRDPQSRMLGELLRSAYQRKVDLLKQAARSSAAT